MESCKSFDYMSDKRCYLSNAVIADGEVSSTGLYYEKTNWVSSASQEQRFCFGNYAASKTVNCTHVFGEMRMRVNENVSLPLLRFVSGHVYLQMGHLSANNLESIGGRFLIIDNDDAEHLHFDKLRRVGDYLHVRRNTKLKSFSVSSLEHLDNDLYLEKNDQLRTALFPKLNYLRDSLQILDNPEIESLSFDALKFIGGNFLVQDNGNDQLGIFQADALTEIADYTMFWDNNFTAMSFRSLLTVGGNFVIKRSPRLASVDLQSLEVITGNHEISDNPGLRQLHYYSLQKIRGSLTLAPLSNSSAGFFADFPSLRSAGHAYVEAEDVRLQACHDLLGFGDGEFNWKYPTGWNYNYSSVDVCNGQQFPSRDAISDKQQICRVSPAPSWVDVGCLPSLTASNGTVLNVMNCSNIALAGEFRIDCINWASVPVFFQPVQVLLVNNNYIEVVPAGGLSCSSILPDLVRVDLSNNPLEWVGFDKEQLAAEECQAALKVASSLQSCPLGASMERLSGWESNVCSCPANSYQPDQTITECEVCPDNCICTHNTMTKDVEARPGWWISNHRGGLKAFRCVNDACCSSNPNSEACAGQRLCATGYSGVKCAECEEGYAQAGSNGCVKCPGDPDMNYLVLAPSAILAVVFCFAMAALTIKSSPNILFTRRMNKHLTQEERKNLKKNRMGTAIAMIKIVVGFVNINGLLMNLNIYVPSPLGGFAGTASSVVAAGSSLGSFSCLVGQGQVFRGRLILWANMPIFLFFLGMVVCVALYFRGMKRILRSAATQSLPPNLEKEQPQGDVQEQIAKLKSRLKDYFVTGFAASFFLLHSTLTSVGLRAFACTAIDAAGTDYRLTSDYSYACYTEDHDYLRFRIALPIILVYVVSAPLIAAFCIHKFPSARTNYLLFLTNGFNDEFPDYFWFYAINLRAVIIVVITTFLSQHFVLQLIGISSFLSLSVIFHVAYWPFELDVLNYAELYGICFSSILFSSAIAFNTNQTTDAKNGVAWTMMLSAVVVLLIFLRMPLKLLFRWLQDLIHFKFFDKEVKKSTKFQRKLLAIERKKHLDIEPAIMHDERVAALSKKHQDDIENYRRLSAEIKRAAEAKAEKTKAKLLSKAKRNYTVHPQMAEQAKAKPGLSKAKTNDSKPLVLPKI